MRNLVVAFIVGAATGGLFVLSVADIGDADRAAPQKTVRAEASPDPVPAAPRIAELPVEAASPAPAESVSPAPDASKPPARDVDPVIPDRPPPTGRAPANYVREESHPELRERERELTGLTLKGDAAGELAVRLLRSGDYPPLKMNDLAWAAGRTGRIVELLDARVPRKALAMALSVYAQNRFEEEKAAKALAGRYREIWNRIRPEDRSPKFFRLAGLAGEAELLSEIARSTEEAESVRLLALGALPRDRIVPVAADLLRDPTSSVGFRRGIVGSLAPGGSATTGDRAETRRLLEHVSRADPNPWIREHAEVRLRWIR